MQQLATEPAAGELSRFPSISFQRVLTKATRYARERDVTLLLQGESGTGKTQFARYLHAASPRAGKPYHDVVLSTLDDTLAASELFGHVSGAFTDARHSRSGHFVSSQGGTLFLDEIGKASLTVQQRLLHVVEYGEFRPVGSDRDVRVDVRIIAATNLDLEAQIAKERFLPDLYARLSAFRLVLPPLRERRADIPLLVMASVAKHGPSAGHAYTPQVNAELMTALQNAPWPNNLRQLDTTMHRIIVDAEGARELTPDHCQDDLSYLSSRPRTPELTPECIDAAIQQVHSISAAARLLGVHRSTVHRHTRGRK